MREFNAAMHSGDAPRDLRVLIADAEIPAPDDTYRDRLIARGDDDIAHMLYDPITERVIPSNRSRAQAAERARREQVAAELQMIRDVMEVI